MVDSNNNNDKNDNQTQNTEGKLVFELEDEIRELTKLLRLQMDQVKHLESEVSRVYKDYSRLEKSGHWWKYTTFLLAFLMGVYGIYYASVTVHNQTVAASKTEAHSWEVGVYREDMTEEKSTMQASSNAIHDMRTVDQKIYWRCQYGHPYSMEEQLILRWDARGKVINAFMLAPYIFNQDVYNAAKQILKYEQSVKDICTLKSFDDYDNNILILQRNANQLMGQEIEKSKNKIKYIK